MESMNEAFGSRGGPWAAQWSGRRKHRGAPFQMWVPQDVEEPGREHGPTREHREGRGSARGDERGRGGERGRGEERGRRGDDRGRGHGEHQRGDHPRGGPFGRGRFGEGFGPGGDFGRGRGRGGRGRRGDVRAAVLLLLEVTPMHGYELIQQITDKSGGTWKPSPGSIYPALSQLEDEGLVLIDKVAGRKTASLTDAGRKFVEDNRADLGSPWDEVSDSVGGDARDLRGLIGQLMAAAGQVAVAGTPRQVDAASEVLVEARRSIYRILADDAPGTSGPGDGDLGDGDSGADSTKRDPAAEQ